MSKIIFRKKHANLLAELVEMLLNLESNQIFNINHWVNNGTSDTTKDEAIECGFACCAVGWAVLSLDSWKKVFSISNVGSIHINGNEYAGYVEIAKFLGITRQESFKLFSPMAYKTKVTPKVVINRIHEVADNNGYILEVQ